MDVSLNDKCCLNKLVLTTIIKKAMREKKGAYNIDYDLAEYIAENIASVIPSDVVINRRQLHKRIRHLEKSNKQLKAHVELQRAEIVMLQNEESEQPQKIMTKPTPHIVKTFTIDNRNQE